jgi:acyl dehydratase
MTPLPTGRFYEDYEVGQEDTTAGRTVSEADVMLFAGLTGDNNQMHTNEAYAAGTHFGGRVAQGLLGLSISHGLMARLGQFEESALAIVGVDKWRFVLPVFLGDSILVRQRVLSKRLTKDGNRGLVTFGVQVVNQRGEVVQEGEQILLYKRRTVDDGSTSA